jgi:hypothetical protein
MAGADVAADAAAEEEDAALSLSAISAATTLSTRRYLPLTRSASFNKYVPIQYKCGIDTNFKYCSKCPRNRQEAYTCFQTTPKCQSPQKHAQMIGSERRTILGRVGDGRVLRVGESRLRLVGRASSRRRGLMRTGSGGGGLALVIVPPRGMNAVVIGAFGGRGCGIVGGGGRGTARRGGTAHVCVQHCLTSIAAKE